MNLRGRHIAAIAAAFVLGAMLLGAFAWYRAGSNAPIHEIFGRAAFLRLEMPEAEPLSPTLDPEATVEEDAELVDAEIAADAGEEEATAAQDNRQSRVSFADRFGDVEMEVSNPSWDDLTFDLAKVGNQNVQDQFAVSKEVTLRGRAIGSLRVYFGGDSSVLVDPDDLIALLKNSSIDTSRLENLAGRNRVAFGTVRQAGVDLRYRPAQDQLAIEATP